jgi:hypothetical protein
MQLLLFTGRSVIRCHCASDDNKLAKSIHTRHASLTFSNLLATTCEAKKGVLRHSAGLASHTFPAGKIAFDTGNHRCYIAGGTAKNHEVIFREASVHEIL